MSEETLTVRVPLAVRKRGGRKVVLAPDKAAVAQEREPANWTLVKNLARAFRWQRMLESGEYATIGELATMEGVTDSYLSRLLKLATMPVSEIEAMLAEPDLASDRGCSDGGPARITAECPKET